MANSKPSFVWTDPFLVGRPTDRRRAGRSATARAPSPKANSQPRIEEAYRPGKDGSRTLPPHGCKPDLLGVTLPEEYGTAGASYVA